jgi:hypothetical protein
LCAQRLEGGEHLADGERFDEAHAALRQLERDLAPAVSSVPKRGRSSASQNR